MFILEAESGQWELCALELPSHARSLAVLWEDPSGEGDMGVGFQKG